MEKEWQEELQERKGAESDSCDRRQRGSFNQLIWPASSTDHRGSLHKLNLLDAH